jgi:nuclear pore complex protein Nup133
MDLDGDVPMSNDHAGPSEMTYAKTDELSVSFYANLPVEVKQVLRNAGV